MTVAAGLLVATAMACGDGTASDGGDAASDDGDAAAFCAGLLALQDPSASDGEVADGSTELVEVAPDAIRAEVTALADHRRAAGAADEDVPAEIQAAIDRIDAFATSACDGWGPANAP